MTRRKLILILAATTALSALALSAARARDVPKVATGFVANVVCTETFVSGIDPARVFAETMSAMPGTGLIAWALDYRVDRARKDVTVTLSPEGTGTRLRQVMVFPDADDLALARGYDAEVRGQETLAKLAASLRE